MQQAAVVPFGIRQTYRDHASLAPPKGARPGHMSPGVEAPEAELATALVNRIHAGDRDAEAEFVDHYRARLLYAVARMIDHGSDAEDIVHEALLIAIQNLRNKPIERPEQLGGYTYAIARNLFRADRRKRSREVGTDPELLNLVAAHNPDHAEALERVHTAQRVRRFIADIEPPRYRELLVRYYVHQQTKDDIRAAMNLSAVHFNRVLFRAKQSFKKLVEQDARTLKPVQGLRHQETEDG